LWRSAFQAPRVVAAGVLAWCQASVLDHRAGGGELGRVAGRGQDRGLHMKTDTRGGIAVARQGRYGGDITAQPASHPDPDEPYEVIHLGGEAAAIVPLPELRWLRAVERRASPNSWRTPR
jgi:hypothetical protein